MAIKSYLLGEGCREGEERVRVSKGKFVLTSSVLYSMESLYESVMIPERILEIPLLESFNLRALPSKKSWESAHLRGY